MISAYTGTAFPGAEAVWKGNSGIARHFVKTILPDAIEGRRPLRDVINGKVNWARKTADPDLPLLKEARDEYARLR